MGALPPDFLYSRLLPKGCVADTITFVVRFCRVKSRGQRNAVHLSPSHAGSFAPSQILLRLKLSSNHTQMGCPGPSCLGSLCPHVAVCRVFCVAVCHVSRVGEGVCSPAVLTTGRRTIFGNCRASTFSIICAQEY